VHGRFIGFLARFDHDCWSKLDFAAQTRLSLDTKQEVKNAVDAAADEQHRPHPAAVNDGLIPGRDFAAAHPDTDVPNP
jgi:hypothetical protein